MPNNSSFSSTPNDTAHQLSREAKWSLYLTLIYVAGWVIFAYFLPNGTGLLGFPLWFEMSCVVLPILFILVSFTVLKTVYKDVDLDNNTQEDSF